MKRYLIAWSLTLILCLMLSAPSFAAPASSSNAAYEEGSADYEPLADSLEIMPYSSIGTVLNTITYSSCEAFLNYQDVNGGPIKAISKPVSSTGSFSCDVGAGNKITAVYIRLSKGALPSPGKYTLSMDLSADVGLTWTNVSLSSVRNTNNATRTWKSEYPPFQQLSGDVYIPPVTIDLGSIDILEFGFIPKETEHLFGGSFRVNLKQYLGSEETSLNTVGTGSEYAQEDFQNSVSGGVSEIVPNTDKMVEELQNQSSYLPMLSNQIANNERTTKEGLQKVETSINSMADQVSDSVDSAASSINSNFDRNMDSLKNDYDNSGLISSNNQLGGAFDSHDAMEGQIFSQISGPLNDFTFSNPVTQYLSTFLIFGNFLQDLFTSSGAFRDVINLSFVMTIALMVAGLYRFKGGN